MVVSDGLRSTLIWSKFKNFPGGACPQTPLQRCALYVRKIKIRALLAPHGHTKNTLCVPLLLQPLDPPLLYTALQLLYKQSPRIDRIVRNLQFSDAIFVSLLYCEAIPQQVHLWIANSTQVGLQISTRTKCRKPFVRLKQASEYQSVRQLIDYSICGTLRYYIFDSSYLTARREGGKGGGRGGEAERCSRR